MSLTSTSFEQRMKDFEEMRRNKLNALAEQSLRDPKTQQHYFRPQIGSQSKVL